MESSGVEDLEGLTFDSSRSPAPRAAWNGGSQDSEIVTENPQKVREKENSPHW
jgi:hypothetical protein